MVAETSMQHGIIFQDQRMALFVGIKPRKLLLAGMLRVGSMSLVVGQATQSGIEREALPVFFCEPTR